MEKRKKDFVLSRHAMAGNSLILRIRTYALHVRKLVSFSRFFPLHRASSCLDCFPVESYEINRLIPPIGAYGNGYVLFHRKHSTENAFVRRNSSTSESHGKVQACPCRLLGVRRLFLNVRCHFRLAPLPQRLK